MSVFQRGKEKLLTDKDCDCVPYIIRHSTQHSTINFEVSEVDICTLKSKKHFHEKCDAIYCLPQWKYDHRSRVEAVFLSHAYLEHNWGEEWSDLQRLKYFLRLSWMKTFLLVLLLEICGKVFHHESQKE